MPYKNYNDVTIISIHGLQEKILCHQKTPLENKIFSFKIDGTNFLILDPYGDDVIPTKIKKNIFDSNINKMFAVLDIKSGQVYTGSLLKEAEKCALLWLFETPLIIPQKYLKNILRDIEYKKRPYRFGISEIGLYNFFERLIGYNDLKNNIFIEFYYLTDKKIRIYKDYISMFESD